MANDKDLKKMLDDWQTRMSADTRLVDQINENLVAQYDSRGTPANERRFIGTDEANRMHCAQLIRKGLEDAIGSSPELKADFVQEIGDGRIKKIEIASKNLGAAGAYDTANDTLLIDPAYVLQAAAKDYDKSALPAYRALIGIIGHELDHSQDRDKDRKESSSYKTEVEKILNDGKDSHDYSKLIGDHLAARGASEAKAQIDYYNSIVLSLDRKDRTEPKIFAAIPDLHKKDFFDADSGKLLPGLTMDSPGSRLLPQTSDNINALEKSFFERPQQLGASNLGRYKDQVAAELVYAILSADKAKEVTINLKAMGVDYNAIQPLLKDIKPPETFYDNSDGTKVKLETDKPLAMTAPAKIEPGKAEPVKNESPKEEPPKKDSPKDESPRPEPRPEMPDDGGGKRKLLEDDGSAQNGREHPLFSQALQHLKAMGPDQGGYSNLKEMQQIAGAVADAAQRRPLASIEFLHSSADGKGLIASWINPGNPLDNDRVSVDKVQARAQPLENSLQRLGSAEQRQETLEPTQTQSTAMVR